MKKLIYTFLFSLFFSSSYAQESCYARLDGDTLYIGNTKVERTFFWNKGNLITTKLLNKTTGETLINQNPKPDFRIMAKECEAENAKFTKYIRSESSSFPGMLSVEIAYRLDHLDIKRIYRLYDDCSAIVCDTYLKGVLNDVFMGVESNAADRKNIEFSEDMKSKEVSVVLDQFHAAGMHWHASVVEFTDVTDWHNNLVYKKDILSYRKIGHRGNLLFAFDGDANRGFYFLKESPCSSVQLAYPGKDFYTEYGKFSVTGLGIEPSDITQDSWCQTYSCVLGVSGSDELSQLMSLREYQKQIRINHPERDEMIMMNTWGDRSQDSKVNETFCLQELEYASRLGITHFQIDDGWQSGKSPNSALAKGSFKNIWSNDKYWTPDSVKYPRGLHPIVERGRELGIQIGLWYNPSVQYDFADWEKDADAITKLYRTYGIKVYKIDGLFIPTKQAEENLRKLFDKVGKDTDEEVIFNLDVTAGRRAGYHMLNEYGSIFLENRYTDWQNYYPYWTLRNLWMLSRYVPAEKLQIEFLNKWRNMEKYQNDSFAPASYSFEYLFSTTIAGQPLAWLEGHNLPSEAFKIKETVDKYKSIQHHLHSGTILPIGDEPSGKSWTGFQSIINDEGYLIIYRESNDESESDIKTWLPKGAHIEVERLLGAGKVASQIVGKEGNILVSIPTPNNYVVFKYTIK